MSRILDKVGELRGLPGVKGAAVIMADGLVVAAALDDRYRSEVVAGLTSYLLTTTNRSLREGGLPACTHFVLHATHGRVVFTNVGEAWLVVVFDQFADLAAARDEVLAAAQQIRQFARLG